MDPVSVISLLAFSKDAIEVIDSIYELFKTVREAPKKLRHLLNELCILRRIVGTIRDVCSQIELANEKVFLSVKEDCEQALSFVQGQANRLYSELCKLSIPESNSRWRTWRMSLKMALADERIIECMNALERGKSLLTAAQASLQIHTITRQTRQIESSAQKIDESIKLNSAIASYCLAQAKIQAVPHEGDTLSVVDTSTLAWHKGSCRDLHTPSPRMRQDVVAEIEPTLTVIKPQVLPLSSTPTVDQFLKQDHKSPSKVSKESDQSSMSVDDGYSHQRLRNSSGHPSNLIPHSQYSQSRLIHNNVTYLSTWLGTIAITQKISVSQNLHRNDGELGTDQMYRSTAIHFTPAPWLSKTAYVLSLQKELTYATSSHLGIALQPVRYTALPQAAFYALRHGDLASIQRILATGQISLHDRQVGKGQNLSLLDLSIDAISWVWLFNEGAVHSDSRVRMMDVIRTARWIFARGTSADTQCQDAILPSSFDFGNMRGSYLNDEIEQMEQLLIEVSEHESPVSRGQRLLSFAISNPEHSLYIDCVVSNIAMEDFTDEEFLSVATAEEQFWTKGSTLDRGQEAVIFHALIGLRKEFRLWHPDRIPQTVIRDVLKGPRRLLFDMLKVAIDAQALTGGERTRWNTDVADYVCSLLRICRDLPLLEDGFGDLLSAYAYEHHIRDCWNAILGHSTGYSDGIDPEMLELDLDASIALFIRLDSERTVLQLDEGQTEIVSASNSAPTILSYFWAFIVLLLRGLT